MVGNLVDQLRRDEGEVLHAYRDSRGYLTLGVGRLIDPAKGGGISETESEMLLANDIAKVEFELNQKLPWTILLDPVRHAVFINMAFNLGVDGLLKFKNTLDLAERGDYINASKSMLSSLWAKQVGARADRLSEQLATGEWR
jgi:lysozyme